MARRRARESATYSPCPRRHRARACRGGPARIAAARPDGAMRPCDGRARCGSDSRARHGNFRRARMSPALARWHIPPARTATSPRPPRPRDHSMNREIFSCIAPGARERHDIRHRGDGYPCGPSWGEQPMSPTRTMGLAGAIAATWLGALASAAVPVTKQAADLRTALATQLPLKETGQITLTEVLASGERLTLKHVVRAPI